MKISSKISWYSYKGNFEIVENPEGLSKGDYVLGKIHFIKVCSADYVVA
jgi:hypothetical protein